MAASVQYAPPLYQFLLVTSSSSFFPLVQEVFEKQIAPIYGDQTEVLQTIGLRRGRICEVMLNSLGQGVGFVVYKKVVRNAVFKVLHIVVIDKSKERYKHALMNRIEKLARDADATRIQADVLKEDEEMRALLRDRDFKRDEIFTYSLNLQKLEEINGKGKRKRERDEEIEVQRRKMEEKPKKQELTLKKKYIHQIRSGMKTIEGRINSGVILRYRPGDEIRFFYHHDPQDDVTCEIKAIRTYPTFEEMLRQEGYQKCLTDVRSLEEAVGVYNAIPGYADRARHSGVSAIELKLKR